MHQPISYFFKTANFELRKIAAVRSFFSKGASVQHNSSRNLGHRDYHRTLCSCWFASGRAFLRIQKIQITLQELFSENLKKTIIIPFFLSERQWLPVKFGVEYKLAALAFADSMVLFHHVFYLFSTFSFPQV